MKDTISAKRYELRCAKPITDKVKEVEIFPELRFNKLSTLKEEKTF